MATLKKCDPGLTQGDKKLESGTSSAYVLSILFPAVTLQLCNFQAFLVDPYFNLSIKCCCFRHGIRRGFKIARTSDRFALFTSYTVSSLFAYLVYGYELHKYLVFCKMVNHLYIF